MERVCQRNGVSESISASVDGSRVFTIVQVHLLRRSPLESLVHCDGLTNTIGAFSTVMQSTHLSATFGHFLSLRSAHWHVKFVQVLFNSRDTVWQRRDELLNNLHLSTDSFPLPLLFLTQRCQSSFRKWRSSSNSALSLCGEELLVGDFSPHPHVSLSSRTFRLVLQVTDCSFCWKHFVTVMMRRLCSASPLSGRDGARRTLLWVSVEKSSLLGICRPHPHHPPTTTTTTQGRSWPGIQSGVGCAAQAQNLFALFFTYLCIIIS